MADKLYPSNLQGYPQYDTDDKGNVESGDTVEYPSDSEYLEEEDEDEDEDPEGFAGEILGDILGGDLGKDRFAWDIAESLVPQPLTREEASQSLCKLGKTANGLQHAYLMMKATDKRVNDIVVITSFKHVMFVDVSGNLLTEKGLSVLQEMEFLLMLKADGNHVNSCVLPAFPYLQHLSLNKNYIMSTEGIIHPLLEVLELNDNSIKNVNGIDPNVLENLKQISLKGNGLETTLGLEIPTLERLYIGENFIEKLEGIECLKKLKILHMRENPISTLEGVEHLESLVYLNIRLCDIKSLAEIKRLAACPKLRTLIVLGNPFVKHLGITYRVKIISILPRLTRIDKSPVQEEELVHADEVMGEDEEIGDTDRESGTDTDF